jgi:hypothetical protein
MGFPIDRRPGSARPGRRRTTSLRAALLIGMLVAVAAPAPAAAAPTAPLTISASATVITWGDSVLLKIKFGSVGANRFVVLQSSRDALAWENINILTTDASGNTSWPYRPATNRYYRAVFQGAPDLEETTSNVVRVVVRQIVILKPSSSKTTVVTAGKQVTFNLSVRPSRPELLRTSFSLAIYRLVSGQWHRFTIRDIPVDPYGNATFAWTFSTRGEWYVRALANPTTDNANSMWSRIERYSVR